MLRNALVWILLPIMPAWAVGQDLPLPGPALPEPALATPALPEQEQATEIAVDTLLPLLASGPFLDRSNVQPVKPASGKPDSAANTPDTEVGNTDPDPTLTTSLSLTDLESLAFQHNPTLAAATARLNAKRGKQFQAGLYPNPVAGYQGMEMGIRGTAGQQGGFIGQRFVMGGKLQLDQAAAGKEVTAAHFEFHAQEQRVLSDVRVRFHNAVILQQRVKLTNELVRIGDELVRATEQLLAGRQATQNDLLLAEIQVDESKILFDNSSNEETEAWRRLAAVIGLPSMQPMPLTEQIETDSPTLDWATCYATIVDNNPILTAAKMRVDRARILIKRARKEPIPDIDLLVAHRHHNVTNENVTNVQIGIPIPLFNRNQGNIRSAEAEWRAASRERERIELGLQDRLAVEYRRYANAVQQSQRYRERMIPRAKTSLKMVTNGYEKGQVQYLTLLTAQRTYWQVSLSYLDAIKELRVATSLIEGQLLSDSLAERY